MSQRHKQKAASRDAILDAAAGLVRERGVNRTSVQEVMAGAGLTVGAFYAHFADKDELFRHAVERALADALAMIRGAADGCTGAEAVATVACHYLSEGHRDSVRRGCPLPAVLGEAASSSGDAKTHAALADLVQTVRGQVEAVAGGAVSANEALAVVALMVGGQIIARATRDTPTSDQVLASCRERAAALTTKTPGRE